MYEIGPSVMKKERKRKKKKKKDRINNRKTKFVHFVVDFLTLKDAYMSRYIQYIQHNKTKERKKDNNC